jgi:hypothetical protein
MAVVETMENNGEKFHVMNVSEAVGPAYGEDDDVMLVKALLKIVLSMNGHPPSKLPEATSGTLDAQTKANIKHWQRRYNQLSESSKNPSRLTVDGRVSRAQGRFAWGSNRPWTIITLNSFAGTYARMYGFTSAAHAIAMMYPHLAKILKLDAEEPEAV